MKGWLRTPFPFLRVQQEVSYPYKSPGKIAIKTVHTTERKKNSWVECVSNPLLLKGEEMLCMPQANTERDEDILD